MVHEDEAEAEFPEDKDTQRQRERLDDLKDRDAFADRLRERDWEKMKKVVEIDHLRMRGQQLRLLRGDNWQMTLKHADMLSLPYGNIRDKNILRNVRYNRSNYCERRL
jgi:hypothetical protein